MDRLPASVIAANPVAEQAQKPQTAQPGPSFPASSPASVYHDVPRPPASSPMASLNLMHHGAPPPPSSISATAPSSLPSAQYAPPYAQSLAFQANPAVSNAFPASAGFPASAAFPSSTPFPAAASPPGGGAQSVLGGYPGGGDVLGASVLGEHAHGVLGETGAAGWENPHGLGGGGRNNFRMPGAYGTNGGLARGSSAGLLPPFAPSGARSVIPNGSLHPSLGQSSVLGGLGGPLTTLGGLPGQPLGQLLQYNPVDERYGLEAMTAPLRSGKRSAYPDPHYAAIPGMGGVLPELPGGGLTDPGPFPALKEETSNTAATRRPRRKRGNRPPGQPSIPVHLRNPKKGRARVFRKCMFCDKDNHIRRSVCHSCKQPLPAGKRRRDGNLSYQREHAAKQRELAAAQAAPPPQVPSAPPGQYATTASTSAQQPPRGQPPSAINPPLSQARPADTGAN